MKYITLFILSVFFIQLSLQQNPAPFFINYTLERLAEGDTFTLGSGPQVLTVTPQGEFGEGWQDLTLNLERTQVNNPDGEWIYEWETLNGEVFSLVDDKGHLVETEHYPLPPPDTGEYVWMASKTLQDLRGATLLLRTALVSLPKESIDFCVDIGRVH